MLNFDLEQHKPDNSDKGSIKSSVYFCIYHKYLKLKYHTNPWLAEQCLTITVQ